jgi:hypothetical protein
VQFVVTTPINTVVYLALTIAAGIALWAVFLINQGRLDVLRAKVAVIHFFDGVFVVLSVSLTVVVGCFIA